MGTTLIDGLGLVLWGLLLGCVGFWMLGEYRALFVRDPRMVITAEVWSQVFLKLGGPGYLASLLLGCAAIFVLGGGATLLTVGLRNLGWL